MISDHLRGEKCSIDLCTSTEFEYISPNTRYSLISNSVFGYILPTHSPTISLNRAEKLNTSVLDFSHNFRRDFDCWFNIIRSSSLMRKIWSSDGMIKGLSIVNGLLPMLIGLPWLLGCCIATSDEILFEYYSAVSFRALLKRFFCCRVTHIITEIICVVSI